MHFNVWLVTCSIGLVIAPSLHAQELKERALPAVPMQLNVRRAMLIQPREDTFSKLDRNQLEEMLYGNLGGSKQAFRRQRRESIQRSIDRVDLACKLSDSQKTKIEQSIEVEIARMESRVTSLISAIQDDTDSKLRKEIFDSAWMQVQSMQTEFQQSENTLWQKTLASVLAPDQLSLLELDQSRISALRQSTAYHRMMLLAQRKLGLNAKQRNALSEFLKQPEHREYDSLAQLAQAIQKTNNQTLGLTEQQVETLNEALVQPRPPFPLPEAAPAPR